MLAVNAFRCSLLNIVERQWNQAARKQTRHLRCSQTARHLWRSAQVGRRSLFLFFLVLAAADAAA